MNQEIIPIVDMMRAEFGFKKTPALYLIDGGEAFAGFFAYASKNGTFTSDYLATLGDVPTLDPHAVGNFIDWLIVNHWGEEEQAEAA